MFGIDILNYVLLIVAGFVLDFVASFHLGYFSDGNIRGAVATDVIGVLLTIFAFRYIMHSEQEWIPGLCYAIGAGFGTWCVLKLRDKSK